MYFYILYESNEGYRGGGVRGAERCRHRNLVGIICSKRMLAALYGRPVGLSVGCL